MNARRTQYERWLRLLVLVVVGGFGVSVGAFWVTSLTPNYLYLGPICITNDVHPGFDPWTGQPHGRNYDRVDCDLEADPAIVQHIEGAIPPEMQGRQALPLPAGFAAGCLITVGALALQDSRRRARPTGAR
jgi:hypothetical protein